MTDWRDGRETGGRQREGGRKSEGRWEQTERMDGRDERISSDREKDVPPENNSGRDKEGKEDIAPTGVLSSSVFMAVYVSSHSAGPPAFAQNYVY